MPPKRSKATATASADAEQPITGTRSTRGKRAAEEPAVEPKSKRATKNGIREDAVEAGDEEPTTDAPKRRGRPPKSADSTQESGSLSMAGILELLDIYQPRDGSGLTHNSESKKRGKTVQKEPASSMFMVLTIRNRPPSVALTPTPEPQTGLGRGKSISQHPTTGRLSFPKEPFTRHENPPDVLTASPDAPKRGRGKKAEPVVEEPEDTITVPKTRSTRSAIAPESESKAVDTAGSQANETKKRGRTAAAQLQEELEDNVAKSTKTTAKRGKAAKAQTEEAAAAPPQEKPKRSKKSNKSEEVVAVEKPAPKTARGRKKATSTTETRAESSEPKTTGIVSHDATAEPAELTDNSGVNRRSTRAKKATEEPKTDEPLTEEKPKTSAAKTTKATKSTTAKTAKAQKATASKTAKAGKPTTSKSTNTSNTATAAEDEAASASKPKAPVRKAGRAKKEPAAEPEEDVAAEESTAPAQPTKETSRTSKRVSIAPGPHPEAATPAKKTPAASKRSSTASIATPELSSSVKSSAKSSGSSKRPAADAEPVEPTSSPTAKRSKRTSSTSEQAAAEAAEHDVPTSSKPSKATPRGSASKTTGRTSMGKTTTRAAAPEAADPASSPAAKRSKRTSTATQQEAEVDDEEVPAIGKSTKATPRTSTSKGRAAPKTPKPTPKAAKASKPPATVQPKKTTKAAGTKRKRASSPGPAPPPKRRNQGSPNVEIDIRPPPTSSNQIEDDYVVVDKDEVLAAREEERVVDQIAKEVAEVVAEQVAQTIEEAVEGDYFCSKPHSTLETLSELRRRRSPSFMTLWSSFPPLDPSKMNFRMLMAPGAFNDGLIDASSNIATTSSVSYNFLPAQIAPSEDLSFLPDAPPIDDPFELRDLRAATTSNRAKAASRRASAGLTPAPEKIGRGGSRAGSRARTLGPSDIVPTTEAEAVTETIKAFDETSTTIPDASLLPLGDDLLSGFGTTADTALALPFLRTPSPERQAIEGAVNDLREAETGHRNGGGFFGNLSSPLGMLVTPNTKATARRERELSAEIAKSILGDQYDAVRGGQREDY